MAEQSWRVDLITPAVVHIRRLPDGTVALVASGAGVTIDLRLPADAAWIVPDLGPEPAEIDTAEQELAPIGEEGAGPSEVETVEPPSGDLPHETPALPPAAAEFDPDPEPALDPAPAPEPAPRPPSPPGGYASCGTATGVRNHRYRGEQLCRDCEEEAAWQAAGEVTP